MQLQPLRNRRDYGEQTEGNSEMDNKKVASELLKLAKELISQTKEEKKPVKS